MQTKGTYDFEATRGDTWRGAKIRILVNGEPLNLTGAGIRMQFKQSAAAPSVAELSVGAGITITDALGGGFTLNAFVFYMPAGRYMYDIEITLASGEIKTYMGGILRLIQDVTT